MGFFLAQEQELHALLQNDALNVPTRYGSRPTIRPELMELLL